MKKSLLFGTAIMTALLFFTIGGALCHASDKKTPEQKHEMSVDRVVLTENTYHATVTLSGFDGQSSRIETEMRSKEGKKIGNDTYTPANEIKMEFAYTDDLDSVIITWSGKNGTQV